MENAMAHTEYQEKLVLLEQLIQRERSFAIKLQVAELKDLQEEKAQLLRELNALEGPCPEDLKEFAGYLRQQNRRNARLLASTLAFLRQTMNNCRREISTVLYGRQGNRIESRAMGLLHTGRI